MLMKVMRQVLLAGLSGLSLSCAAPVQMRTAADAEPAGVDGADALGTDAVDIQSSSLVDAPQEVAPAAALAPCREAIAGPHWWTGAVGYEIFVRSFADSNADGIGDIPGIMAHFDYLNDGKPGGDDLGVDLIWLMPVFPSPSYHGYDVSDYKAVQPDYGTLADVDALLQLAHSRGVKVILDWVPNHASKKHPFFVGSAAGTDHQDWFVWRDTAPELAWKQPWSGTGKVWHASGKRWYYGVFSSSMPDWNVTQPAVSQYLQDAAAFWLERGVDGLRLDAVRYLVETGPGKGQQDTDATLAWWKDFSALVGKTRPGSLLIGEAWASNTIAGKYQQAGLQMTFDFDLQASLLSAVQGGIADGLQTVACQEDATIGKGAARGVFLSNHDMTRWTSQVVDPQAQKLAESLQFFVPGTPFLYYGEEIGAPNGPSSDDTDKRLPMRWDDTAAGGFSAAAPWQALVPGPSVASSLKDKASLLRHVQRLIAVRGQTEALQRGALTFLPAPDGWLLAVRSLAGQRVLGVFHLSDEGPTPCPSLQGLGPANSAQDLLTGQAVVVSGGVPQIGPLAAYAARWIIVN